MKFSRRKILVILSIVLAALAAGFYWWSSNNESKVTRIVNEIPQQEEQVASGDGEYTEENSEEAQSDESPAKDPSPPASAIVTEPPLVYTGYGHGEDDPLKLNQETSTTCTTAAGASCSISFKSSDGKSAQLEAKTADSQGVVVWNWRGDEVGSGTWSVTAVAGDKVSNVETIYIQ